MSIYPWQQSQWQQLQLAKQNNRLSHALLLSGPVGVGKHDFAYAFAKDLLCDSSHAQELFAANTHPDFFVLSPEEDSKVIKVDQVRELIAAVNQTAQYGNYQVVIIEPAESLNMAAANALLKTLEEPQGKVIFLLVSQQSSQLPATIRSRCQTVLFNTPAITVTKNWLSEKIPPNADAEKLLKQADGAPLLALTLANNDSNENYKILLQQLWQIMQGEINPVVIAAEYAKQDAIKAIDYLMQLVTDLLRFKQTQQAQFVIFSDDLSLLTRLSQQLSLMNLFYFLDFLTNRKNLLLRHPSINVQLLCEEVFLKWDKIKC